MINRGERIQPRLRANKSYPESYGEKDSKTRTLLRAGVVTFAQGNYRDAYIHIYHSRCNFFFLFATKQFSIERKHYCVLQYSRIFSTSGHFYYSSQVGRQLQNEPLNCITTITF